MMAPLSPRNALAALGMGMDTGAAKAIFAGIGAKTADKAALAKAEKMAAKGADPKAIWRDTGWFKGGDGKWRFEIDDSAAAFIDKGFTKLPGGTLASKGSRVDKVIAHDQLYSAYPEARRIDPAIMIGGDPSAASTGSFSEVRGLLEARGHNHQETLGTGLHEFQHAIQGREGFARGGNADMVASSGATKDNQMDWARKAYEASSQSHGDPLLAELFGGIDVAPWDKLPDRKKLEWLAQGRQMAYQHLAGEAEARAVQSRMYMTPQQRREVFPLNSYDVPIDSLIYR
jgi:hypothetical protein